MQTAVNGEEWYNANYPGVAPTISTSTKRSGAASLRVSSLSSGTRQMVAHRFPLAGVASVADGTTAYARGYLYISTLPSADNCIFGFTNIDTGEGTAARVRLSSTGTLKVYINSGGTLTLVGTSAALSLNTWYRIELSQFRNAATPGASLDAVELKIDGSSSVSSSTLSIAAAARCLMAGGNCGAEAQTQGEWFFDDLAVNDSTGSAQTSWPGDGTVVNLNINGAGEFAQTLTLATGETNAWEALDEIGVDDATSYVVFTDNSAAWNTAAAASRAMFALESMPASPASITVVHVGIRLSNLSASGSNMVIGIQTSNGGTKSEATLGSFANGTQWFTNHSSTSDRSYKITNYLDPDGAAWTESTINSLQVGARATDAAPDINVSKMWAVLEYVPGGGGGSLIKTVNGLAIASVKTINGLAIASVKTYNGLTNV